MLMSVKGGGLLLILCVLCAALPPDPPPERPLPSAVDPGEAFAALKCSCDETFLNAYRCDALPAFRDNEWTHENAREFAVRAADFAAKVETAEQDFHRRHYLALQGRADRRKIGKKTWSEASPRCRAGHTADAPVTNRELAFLRACELRQLFREPLASQIDLLPPVDYTDPKARLNRNESYSGDSYKAAVLFIVFPERRVCPR